ncbi:hypothetical protein PM082_004385 [Marasmius tenuissimus]|nr:hypothetical protein PM082_004385 [Marasmius tenuissimus]
MILLVVDRCKAWDDAREEEATADCEALFRARRNAIATRLIQLDWEPLVLLNHWVKFDSNVRQTKPLTEKIWQNIKPKLESKRVKYHRYVQEPLEKPRYEILQKLIEESDVRKNLPRGLAMPSAPELAKMDPFRTLIQPPSTRILSLPSLMRCSPE